MEMGIDNPRKHHLAFGLDDLVEAQIGRNIGMLADRNNPIILKSDRAAFDDATILVYRYDEIRIPD
jgi:hypothetical protein